MTSTGEEAAEDKPQQSNSKGLSKVLAENSERIAASVFTVGGLTTIVAAVGAGLTWLRFYSAQLPANEAIRDVPQKQFVAAGVATLVIFILLGAAAVLIAYFLERGGRPRPRMAVGLIAVVAVESAVILLLTHKALEDLILPGVLLPVGIGAAISLCVSGRLKGKTWKLKADLKRTDDEETDPTKEPPNRLILTLLGWALLAAIIISGAVIEGALVSEVWVGIGIAAAAALAVANFMVAWNTGTSFSWYGVSVLFAVVVLGVVVQALRILDKPTVRPAAIILAGGGSDRGVEGLYVTQTDKEIILATVSTDGCGSFDLVRGSGRIVSYPREAVLAKTVGRMQTIEDAVPRSVQLLDELSVRPLPPQTAQSSTDTSTPAPATTTTSTTPSPTASSSGTTPNGSATSPGTTTVPKTPAGSPGTAPSGSATSTTGARSSAASPSHAAVPAVRPEPKFGMSSRRIRPGGIVTLTADADSNSHFTTERGGVTVGGRKATILHWDDTKIRFKAPAKATTSLVTVNCSPLSGRVLTVLSPPVARVRAQPSPPGSSTYQLDAGASGDKDGEILRYRWSATVGSTPKGNRVASFELPETAETSTVKLVVSDDDLAASKPAQVVVSRIRASALFCFRCRTLGAAGRRTLTADKKRAAGAHFVLIEGHADFIGSDASNLTLSRDRARAVERYLVSGLGAQRPKLMRVRWYGERHPLDKRRTDAARASNRRVNVLISRSG